MITSASASHLAQRWQVNTANGDATAPAMVNGVLYHAVNPGNYHNPGSLTTNSALTGKKLWSTALPTERAYFRGLAVVGSLALMPFDGLGNAGGVTAVNITTHKIAWSRSAPVVPGTTDDGSLDGFQADSSRAVVVSGDVMCAFSTSSGALLWKRNVSGSYLTGMVMRDGVLYTTSSRAGLTSYNAGTGAVKWTAPYADGTPVVSSGRVIASSGTGIAAWPAAGCGHSVCSALWTTVIGAEPGDTLIGGVDGSTLFATTTLASDSTGRLDRLSASTGKVQWSVVIKQSASLPVRVADTVWIVNNAQYLVGWSATATTATPLRTITEGDDPISDLQGIADANGTLAVEIWPDTITGYRVAGT